MTYKFDDNTRTLLEEYRVEYKKVLDKILKIFENLQDNFRVEAELRSELNPMMHFYSRCKTVSSIEGKINKDIEKDIFSVVDINNVGKVIEHLHDFAATRILCPNKKSVFEVVRALKEQEGLDFIDEKEKNMIGESVIFGEFKEFSERATEERGYRSYHLITLIDGKSIEIQVRTYGMEFWGQIEHDMNYKHEVNTGVPIPQQIKDELVKTSNQIDAIDNKLYRLYEMILMNDSIQNKD